MELKDWLVRGSLLCLVALAGIVVGALLVSMPRQSTDRGVVRAPEFKRAETLSYQFFIPQVENSAKTKTTVRILNPTHADTAYDITLRDPSTAETLGACTIELQGAFTVKDWCIEADDFAGEKTANVEIKAGGPGYYLAVDAFTTKTSPHNPPAVRNLPVYSYPQ